MILGSTGSIGTQALDVVERSRRPRGRRRWPPDSSWELLVEQAAAATASTRIALADERRRRARGRGAGPAARCSPGPTGSCELITETGADLVLNALVGSAGLGPTVAALGEGIDLALANKESLVVGGELVMALAEAHRRARSSRSTPSTRRCSS